MNIYGLQGIAETINAFASEEIKQEYLPDMADGKWTGAMVLTEPDAGSDLQAVKCRAYQDDDGNWFVHGVKRFITNGCGEVLLVLARTEPEITDGRGLSLLRRRARAEGQGPPAGEQARHPRQPDVRAVLRPRPGQAHRRAAARADHLRHEPDERRPHRHRRPVAGHRRGGLPRRPRLRATAASSSAWPSRTSPPSANCWSR